MADSQNSVNFSSDNILWVLLSGAITLAIILLLVLSPNSVYGIIASAYSLVLWSGIFGASICRYCKNSGWLGFSVGSVIGGTIYLLTQHI